jgi:hypothetical protein
VNCRYAFGKFPTAFGNHAFRRAFRLLPSSRRCREQPLHQATTHQPGQRFDEKIPGIMFLLFLGPFSRGEMAHQDHALIIEKDKPGRAVCEPADVFRSSPQKRPFGDNQTPVRLTTYSFHENKYNALRGLRLEES